MKKLRLEFDEKNRVKNIFHDTWSHEEYKVPDDFEEKFIEGIPYCLVNDKIVIDSEELEKKKIEEELFELEDYLASTTDSAEEINDYLAFDEKVPNHLLIIMEKRRKTRDKIKKLEKVIKDV